LAAGTFRELFESRARIRQFQKSRLRRAEWISRAIARGKLKIVRSVLSPRDPLVEETGAELAGLLRAAEGSNGIVLRPAPVHKPGVENLDDADLSAHATIISDMHALLRVLTIDQVTEETAKRYFEVQDKGWAASASPDVTRSLYIDSLALNYLDSVHLMDIVLDTFAEVFIDASTEEDASALIEHDQHTTEVLRVIDTIRDVIRKAQTDKRIIFGPPRSTDDSNKDDGGAFESPTLNLISNLMQAEVAVFDDRGLNKEPFTQDSSGHRARTVTSLDLLEELHARGNVSDDERRNLRHRLRTAGAALVPADEQEIISAALRSRSAESAELRAIRESVLLARVAQAPRLPAEMPWFAHVSLALKNAVMRVWLNEPDHKRAANLATKLIDLTIDPQDWVDQWEGQVPPQWAQSVRMVMLANLAVPVELDDEETLEAYHSWVEDKVLAPLRVRSPDDYAAVVEQIRNFLDAVSETDDD
jgi:hypothetical protein